MRYVLGVDEAGRGPLAGPVAVGVVMVPEEMLPKLRRMFRGVNDSKQLTEDARERIYELLCRHAAAEALGEPAIRFCVRFASADTIDKKGIVPAVFGCVSRGIGMLAPLHAHPNAEGPAEAHEYRVLLDGALRAPDAYAQETVIRGDEIHPIISLASIAAKVERDRLMTKLATRYPAYGFERHKGYGTEFHYEMLAKFGSCAIHRRSFLPLEMRPQEAYPV